MRYRYRPVFDGDELIAFAYWTGDCVQHYYINKSFFIQSLLERHTPTVPDKHIIKSLDEITLDDYPKEVRTHVKQLHLGEEALTDNLPSPLKIEYMQVFVNWFRRKAKDFGQTLKLATWDD
jgi:hypothetical protein